MPVVNPQHRSPEPAWGHIVSLESREPHSREFEDGPPGPSAKWLPTTMTEMFSSPRQPAADGDPDEPARNVPAASQWLLPETETAIRAEPDPDSAVEAWADSDGLVPSSIPASRWLPADLRIEAATRADSAREPTIDSLAAPTQDVEPAQPESRPASPAGLVPHAASRWLPANGAASSEAEIDSEGARRADPPSDQAVAPGQPSADQQEQSVFAELRASVIAHPRPFVAAVALVFLYALRGRRRSSRGGPAAGSGQ